MNYTKLGRTGLRVSKVCLGTMTFGKMNDEKESFRILDAALDAGINFIDTSNTYGGGVDRHGKVEEILGRWFTLGGGRREKVVLTTKVYSKMYDEADGPNDENGISAYKIYRSVEKSMKRMRTDYIEIYTQHHVDRSVPYDEIFEAYENLIRQGKICYVGSSNSGARDIVRAHYEAQNRHFLGFVAEQHKYNLFVRLPELEVMPACQELGVAFMPYSPLAGGYLGENALNPKPNTRSAGGNIYSDNLGVFNQGKNREQLLEFEKLCKEIGALQSDVALAWLLQNPLVTCPVVGPRTWEQFQGVLRAMELKLDEDVLKKLDEIFPGPGGSAPEAYAW